VLPSTGEGMSSAFMILKAYKQTSGLDAPKNKSKGKS
jgi:hypothetical protein